MNDKELEELGHKASMRKYDPESWSAGYQKGYQRGRAYRVDYCDKWLWACNGFSAGFGLAVLLMLVVRYWG